MSAKKMAGMYGEEAGEFMAKRFIAMNEDTIRNFCYDCAHVDLTVLSDEMLKQYL